jgi:hypothetical protein
MSTPYREIVSDTEAARRGVVPPVANRPEPAQAFGKGASTGREAAISREVNPKKPRRE